MSELRREEGLSIEESNATSLTQWLELVHKYRSMTPPDNLSVSERTEYMEAVDAIKRVKSLQKILGVDNITSEKAAEHFLGLAEKITKLPRNDKERISMEEDLSLIASSFGLNKKGSGTGNVLAAAGFSGQSEESHNDLFSYAKRIGNGKLEDNIQQALDFLQSHS